MNLSNTQLLRRLGSGESITALCEAAGITRPQFDDWWREQTAARCPAAEGSAIEAVQSNVTIERDRRGIPHIYAENDADLFFGFGYAMAGDRLFQLDYLRRKGHGRLAEVLGPEAVPIDTVTRTVGLNHIAAAEWKRLEPEVQALLEAFSAGINAVIRDAADNPPIEFDLLDYRPEPWTPIDCLAIENEFRWYLTGRLPVIAMPELAKRVLGDGPLYEEYLLGEADEDSILHPGEYDTADPGEQREPIGHVMADPDDTIGSNNWVISGQRTTTGLPLVASDPHIAFEAVSCWYPVHLCGGSFNVAGTAYVGIPAVMIGRNERVAWGITNNICMQRDLYQEKTDPAHPGCFLNDGEWTPGKQHREVISVKDGDPVELAVNSSHNGPIVDHLLPPETQHTGPVSLKWLGAYHGGWLTAMLDMDRADSTEDFRESLRPWHVPTFSLVFADVEGHVGFQTTGRIPVRDSLQRGYRPGWDPQHQWRGLIPFDEMPRLTDPDRGWIATANNRVAPDDYPRQLFGCWVSGWRAKRIAQMIEATPQLSIDEMQSMQLDMKSLRAAELIPALLPHLDGHADPRVQSAAEILREWDCYSTSDSAGAAIFNVFFTAWCRRVASEHFEPAQIELMSKGVEWCAGRLLSSDPAGWFREGNREERIVEAFDEAISLLSDRFGPEMQNWNWGEVHRMPLKHVLSERGDLGELLDWGGLPVGGDMVTVGNTGGGPNWTATTGGGYRMVCDLHKQPPALYSVDAQGQSGHVGSPHYDDQFDTWLNGDNHEISLDRETATSSSVTRCILKPAEATD